MCSFVHVQYNSGITSSRGRGAGGRELLRWGGGGGDGSRLRGKLGESLPPRSEGIGGRGSLGGGGSVLHGSVGTGGRGKSGGGGR